MIKKESPPPASYFDGLESLPWWRTFAVAAATAAVVAMTTMVVAMAAVRQQQSTKAPTYYWCVQILLMLQQQAMVANIHFSFNKCASYLLLLSFLLVILFFTQKLYATGPSSQNYCFMCATAHFFTLLPIMNNPKRYTALFYQELKSCQTNLQRKLS